MDMDQLVQLVSKILIIAALDTWSFMDPQQAKEKSTENGGASQKNRDM